MEEVIGQMSNEQYWRWRFYISEMQLADAKAKLSGSQLQTLDRELEILRLKASLFKNTVSAQQEASERAKSQYQEVRSQLESELGCTLADCVVDEITYEVKKLTQG